MSARYIIGDTRDVLATIPDGSIDLVMTSPPFLALRSYLPADHPDKHREIGSEPDPATFLDTLLALTADWRRVLAPHGSICVELGDTYSGSGGAGGDYNPDGLRDGQSKFDGVNHRRGKVVDHDSGRRNPGPGWPLPKSLCGIPHLYHLSLAYGRNLLTGEESPAGRWRVRNVVAWCRPNPPVGALGDKFRPATSYMTIATPYGKRYFDLDAVRTEHKHPDDASRARTGHRDAGKVGGDGASNPAGAPPLDYWVIPTAPYSGSHYAVYPPALCERPIKSMVPAKVCTVCGAPSERIVENLGARRFANPMTAAEFGAEMVAAMKRAEMTENDLASVVGVTRGMVRHWRAETATPQLPSVARWEELGDLLPFDHWVRDALRVVEPEYETVDRGNRQINGRLSGGPAAGDKPKVVATGWTDCGHDSWRNGVVLDPFAGSGTTLMVATGHGRDAIGVDIDERNAELALDRVGPLMLTVEHLADEVAS